MRILYVCADPGTSPFGDDGAAAHLRGMTGALAARGHAVTLACRRTDGRNPLPAGVAVAVMPEGWNAQVTWMGSQMRRYGIDVVIERFSLRTGPALDAVAGYPLPLLFEVDAPLVDEAVAGGALEDAESWRRWEARMLTAADHVVAVSEVVAWHVLGRGVSRSRLSVVPNGVDPVRFAGVQGHSVRLEHDLGRRFVVVFCGSLQPWHGVEDAVEAMAMLPPSVALLVVGDGPRRKAVAARAADLGVADRVILAGAVAETDIPVYLAAADAGIAPYTAVERFYYSPLKVLEYCASGLPVVATAQGELAHLGGAAVLVPPADPIALAEAVATLAETDGMRREMSRAGRAHAAAHTWAQAAERIELLAVGLRQLDPPSRPALRPRHRAAH